MNSYLKYGAWFFAGLFFLTGCQNQEYREFPTHFPKMEIPENNLLTLEKIELGRQLFYEKGLSIDSTISCASCHKQQFAFTDNVAYSFGSLDSIGIRNTRGLSNTGYLKNYFGEGGLHSLERATIAPMQTEFEMNQNIKETLERLQSNKTYAKQFKSVFNDSVNHQNLLWALSAFQRTLISANSPYDQFLVGDSSALSEEQLFGLQLFNSERLGCANCHSGVLFTDEQAYNIGLYANNPDYGRGRLTLDSADHGAFLTPSLRNVQLTAPYMHDGSLSSLEEVIVFYASGGVEHYAKTDKMHPIAMDEDAKKAVIAFLCALTDSSFITNPKFSNPN